MPSGCRSNDLVQQLPEITFDSRPSGWRPVIANGHVATRPVPKHCARLYQRDKPFKRLHPNVLQAKKLFVGSNLMG